MKIAAGIGSSHGRAVASARRSLTRASLVLAGVFLAGPAASTTLAVQLLASRSIPAAAALSNQTITFAAIANKTYGVVPFTVNPTASSGLPVTLTSLTLPVCTVSPAFLVTVAGAGTCTIKASQAGNATFAAAPDVSRTFTIAKANQTITFAAIAGKTYGVAPFAIAATATSGLPVTLTSTTLPVCTLAGSMLTAVAAGTCSVTASQAGNGNYNVATGVVRTFTVAQASQTITFAALPGATFGAAPFTVSATATSGLPVVFASTTGAVCTVNVATVTIIAAGSCTIQASQGGDGNYKAAPVVSHSFTVAKASQTISFAALASATFGALPFDVSATASSGLAVVFTSTTASVCTVAAATVTIIGGGTCTVRASQAGNGNYTAAPNVNQSFTVTKASQSIDFAALPPATFGAPPFVVSATASSGLAVTFASTTGSVCTVSGATVTIVAGGTCTVRASQAGNGNYAAAPNVSQSFTIAKASQTISFGALLDKPVNSSPFAVTASASSGLAVTFTSTTAAVCTLSGTTVTLVAVGTCTIRAAQAGNSGYSAAANVSQSFAVTVVLQSQTISFGALSNQTYGVTPFGVSASATSGLPVTFASFTAPVCTVSGSIVTVVGVGTCTIQASQAGNAAYAPAPIVSQSFTVAQAAQTISFAALGSQILGAAPFTLSATASSGLPVAFASLTTPVCTVSGSTVALVSAGTCTIQASQAGNANYVAAPSVSQSFAVTTALLAQTIAFGALANQAFGAAPFAVSASATSGLPVSFASLTAPVCTVSGSTVTLVSAGTCTLQASQAGNAIYAPAPNVSQSFSVAKAAQTISFAALSSQILGAAPFTVSASASSGLAVSFTSLTTPVCTMSGSTVTLVSAGTCTVQASQAGNANYAAAPNVSQSFAVTNALQSQTITFNALSNQVFGAAPFSVSASATSGLPVSFASLTGSVCTVAGATVTIASVGTCTVQASQAGNATYAAAPNVSQSFTVAQGAQGIIFGALGSQIFGAAPFTVAATASSGLTVSFTSLTTSVCTVSGSTVTLVSAGTCTVQASQAGNANYAAAPNVSQSFNVAKASQTILFGAIANRPIGAPAFTVSATASSGLTVSFASLTSGVCTVSVATVTLVAVGTCTIEASQAGNANVSAAANVDQGFSVTSGSSSTISFAPAVNYPSATNPNGIAVADFNGDGKPDLAVVNSTSSNVRVFIGNGDGTFVPGATLTTGQLPSQIAVADFNGDGKLDIAVTNILGNSVSIFLGGGNGTFGAPSTVPAGLAPFGIKAADLNGDGKIDLVVANGSSGSIIGQTVTVLLGNGNGTFQSPHAYLTGVSPQGLAIADFNADGKPDLAVTNRVDNTVSILLGNGDGTFRPQVTYATGINPQSILVADFNADGKPDLAIVNTSNGNVSVLLGNGNGTFAAATNYTVGFAPDPLAIGDFNGDGIVDIVTTNTLNNLVVVLQGNGDGTFKAGGVFAVGTQPEGLAVGDFNADGKLDLAVSNYGSNTVSVMLNGPSGITVLPLTGTPQSAVINTLYSTALSVSVRDASNAPIVGANVAFVAPVSGASGSFQGTTNTASATTNASGVATAPPFTANGTVGAFTVTGTYSGPSANFALTNTTPALINQTITFGALSNKVLASAPFAVTASASSGLAVTFSSRTLPVCTVSGSTVTLVAAGTCTVRASQGGNATYAAAPDVDQSFSVTVPATIQYMYDAAGNLIGIQHNGSP